MHFYHFSLYGTLLHPVAPCCTLLHPVAPCCTLLHPVCTLFAPCCTTQVYKGATCCTQNFFKKINLEKKIKKKKKI